MKVVVNWFDRMLRFLWELSNECLDDERKTMKITRIAAWGLAGILLLVTFRAFPVDEKYKPSEVQALRLQVKQKDAQLAQQAFSIAQQQFQQKIGDFNAEIKKIEEENHWPETLQVDPNTLEFRDVSAPPPEKPAQK